MLRYLQSLLPANIEAIIRTRLKPGDMGDIVFPRVCCLCLQRVDEKRDICKSCIDSLYVIGKACIRCGDRIALEGNSGQQVCGRCSHAPPAYRMTLAPWSFEAPLQEMIQAFKFQRNLVMGRVLSELAGDYFVHQYQQYQDVWPQALIPVPLHWRRYWRRGFNQSLLIAKDMQRDLQRNNISIDLLTKALRRVRNTQPQPGLQLTQRRRNLRNAFQVNLRSDLPDHVALVDDVMTTGSTVNECTKALLKAGCKRVDVWVLARALRD